MPRNGGLVAVGCIDRRARRRADLVRHDCAERIARSSRARSAGSGEPDPPGPSRETNGQLSRSRRPFEDEFHTIFDEKSTAGWILSDKDKKPLPRSHIQKDGLNPHRTGSYLVVYHEKLSDFELDFDYKLEKGCNSGVFLRVSDLADPIRTGIEVAPRRHDRQRIRRFGGVLRPGRTRGERPEARWPVEPHDDHRPGPRDPASS